MTVTVDKPAPLFTLKDANGDKVALKNFKGRSVVVFFYPKDNTPGCTKEACAFRDLWDEFGALGVAVLGISPDDGDSHQRFSAEHQLPMTLLSDPDHKVMEKYGAWGEKNMYGKKVVGVIRSTVWIGKNGKVKKHWRRVTKAADHPAKVLELLQADSD